MRIKSFILILSLISLILSCGGNGGDSSTSPSPTPTTTTTTVQVEPKLTSSAVQINRSSGNYHYIGWQFTIDSPRAYGYAYVEIRWYDANGFQIEWSNWAEALKQGIHTYSDETMVLKEIWGRIIRREVVLLTWR